MAISSRAALAAQRSRTPEATPRRRRGGRLVLAVAAVLVMEAAAAGSGFVIRNGTVAGGGGDVTQGNFRVVWTIGEAAMGTTSAEGFRLTSGFPATIGDSDIQGGPIGGPIFKDGFESTGGTAP